MYFPRYVSRPHVGFVYQQKCNTEGKSSLHPICLLQPEFETVTLLNASPELVELTGWKIVDRLKNGQSATGTLAAGVILKVPVQPPVQLGNRGDEITLLDDRGLKVDVVSYTEQEAQRKGWTLVF